MDLLEGVSPFTRRSVFGVCDQVRHKLACAATETSTSLEISYIATTGIILSKERTTKEGDDQTAQMRSLICTFVARISQK